jgi:hypothetical protein
MASTLAAAVRFTLVPARAIPLPPTKKKADITTATMNLCGLDNITLTFVSRYERQLPTDKSLRSAGCMSRLWRRELAHSLSTAIFREAQLSQPGDVTAFLPQHGYWKFRKYAVNP